MEGCQKAREIPCLRIVAVETVHTAGVQKFDLWRELSAAMVVVAVAPLSKTTSRRATNRLEKLLYHNNPHMTLPLAHRSLQAARRLTVARATTTPLHFSTEATAPVEDVPPIVWTTHLLKNDQISKVDGIFHKILWLDMFEVSMLNALINERLGLKLTPKQNAAIRRQLEALRGETPTSAAATETEEEAAPQTVDLKLVGFDAKAKIKVIKEVRSIAGLGLKEAKELVESAPKVVMKDLKPEQAEELQAKLQAVGGQVELA